MLTFLQLSDIHFRGTGATDGEDGALDYGFREQLITDARAVVAAQGGVSGIFVCGDIANVGSGSEFGQALEWLENLCRAIDLDPWLIWVVPGNHDLDWSKIGDPQWRLRGELRECKPADIDQIVERIFASPTHSQALIEPLQNYLEFASTFNCFFDADPYWTDELQLSEHRLELRGLNSALLCGPGDSYKKDEMKMIIGSRQAILTAPEAVHFTLCHHPGSWLRDPPEVERLIDNGVNVRVTGHVHVRGVRETPAGIHLAAGAVSPEHHPEHGFRDPCIPRYELISLRSSEVAGDSYLDVFIDGRYWDEEDGWQPEPDTLSRRYQLGVANSGQDIESPNAVSAARIERPLLKLRYRLARLPEYDRGQCAQRIGVPINVIADTPAHREVVVIFEHAEEADKLDELWNAVFDAAGLGPQSENPFADG